MLPRQSEILIWKISSCLGVKVYDEVSSLPTHYTFENLVPFHPKVRCFGDRLGKCALRASSLGALLFLHLVHLVITFCGGFRQVEFELVKWFTVPTLYAKHILELSFWVKMI